MPVRDSGIYSPLGFGLVIISVRGKRDSWENRRYANVHRIFTTLEVQKALIPGFRKPINGNGE
ncbi:MAG: hypothetical protein F6K26_32550 [Moorea sp. SIO2I5]|nr:hypothetical protein [Moorena sp. SIO2I5]